jgi:GTP-dependent phosphoenolpyruvate carboxykinase
VAQATELLKPVWQGLGWSELPTLANWSGRWWPSSSRCAAHKRIEANTGEKRRTQPDE